MIPVIVIAGIAVGCVGMTAQSNLRRQTPWLGVGQGCHADADHIDGLPDLLDRFAIGALRVAPGFAGADGSASARLLAAARARGLAIEEVTAGDHWAVGVATLDALHPPPGWRPD